MYDNDFNWDAGKISDDLKRLTMAQWSERTYPQLSIDATSRPEFSAVFSAAFKYSLAGVLYSLAKLKGKHIDVYSNFPRHHGQYPIRSYSDDSLERYTCVNGGVNVYESSDPRSRRRKWIISSRVVTPSHPEKDPFSMLKTMLKSQGIPDPVFLELMSEWGWFGTNKQEILIEMAVYRKMNAPDYAYNPSKWSDKSISEPDFIAGEMSLTIGDWKLTTNPGEALGGIFSPMMSSCGYEDQILVTKRGTKGMEGLLIYLPPVSSGNMPFYQVVRSSELEGLVGNKFWTEKELALAEMLDVRDEIFLDRPGDFPILSLIPEITRSQIDALWPSYNFWGNEKAKDASLWHGRIKLPRL